MTSRSAFPAASARPPSRASSRASRGAAGRSPSPPASAGAGIQASGIRATNVYVAASERGLQRTSEFFGARPPPTVRRLAAADESTLDKRAHLADDPPMNRAGGFRAWAAFLLVAVSACAG